MPPPTHLDLLSDYGLFRDQHLGEHSLANASELASGSVSMVILLQEPCNLADRAPYEEMVYGNQDASEWSAEYEGSPTLRKIDDLIKYVSAGDLDLRHVHVFDLNTLLSRDVQPKSLDHERDDDLWDAHSTCWKMIEAVKPSVILVLTTQAGRSNEAELKQLRCSRRSAGSTKKVDIKGRESLVVFGFHPSVYLRGDYVDKEEWSEAEVELAQEVLYSCFDRAFASLDDRGYVPMSNELLKSWKELTKPRQLRRQIPRRTSLEEALEKLGL